MKSNYCCFTTVVHNENHEDNDCLLIAVLTHGEHGKLYGFDKKYNTEKLWENFSGKKCPSLAGKPKIFLIQV